METVIVIGMVLAISIGAYWVLRRKNESPSAASGMEGNPSGANKKGALDIDEMRRQEAEAARQLALSGLSNDEAKCLAQARQLLERLSPSTESIERRTKEKLITDLFFQTRAVTEVRHGADVCRTNYGDEVVNDASYMAPRLESGLSTDEVREYWSQPLLMAMLIPEIHALSKSLYENALVESAKVSQQEAERQFRQAHVVYGNPISDRQQILQMGGYTEQDAALYVEFSKRAQRLASTLKTALKRNPDPDSALNISMNAKLRRLFAETQR